MSEALYDRGIAVGDPNIEEDSMVFRFRHEVFVFPTLTVHPFAEYNGYFYTIPVDKLRELEREAAGKK